MPKTVDQYRTYIIPELLGTARVLTDANYWIYESDSDCVYFKALVPTKSVT